MYSFERLIVWTKALQCIKNIYSCTEGLKDIGLKDQIRRAATSIAINIPEGSGSENDKEFKRYLYISRKSLYEVVACLKIITKLYNTEYSQIENEIDEIGKLLNGLIRKVKLNIA